MREIVTLLSETAFDRRAEAGLGGGVSRVFSCRIVLESPNHTYVMNTVAVHCCAQHTAQFLL